MTSKPEVQIARFDLGVVDLGRTKGAFRAPVRGTLVVPAKARANAPLVVISHMRAQGCETDDIVDAHPCPAGIRERRIDHGLTYLGIDLARFGYAVLIPDLSPLYVARDPKAPYDQAAGWLKTVGLMRTRLQEADRGGRRFGLDLRDRIDMRRVGLVTHSRSSWIAGPVVRAWRTTTPIAGVFAYGPADTVDSPPAPDVPYLALLGTKDKDVDQYATQWIGDDLGRPRRFPLAIGMVEGFGHNYVNTTLSDRRIDDRVCDGDCRSPLTHRRLMQNTALAWMDATMRGRTAPFPMSATGPLPASIVGEKVRWLAVSNAPGVVTAHDSVRGIRGVTPVGDGAVSTCIYYAPQTPDEFAPHRCPAVEGVDVASVARTTQVRLTPTGGARFPTAATRVTGVVVHVNPSRARTVRQGPTPLRVTLVDARGGRTVADVPAGAAALAPLTGEPIITPSTVRLPMTARDVIAVELTGGRGPGALDVRRIELLTR